MTYCHYCEDNHLEHVDPQSILGIMFKMEQQDRLTLIKFMEKLNDESHYHSTIAVTAIEDNFCNGCGSVTEREEDDDRYIYICVNQDCPVWKRNCQLK